MKFLIIGDTCSDRFCYGSSERLCPEAPAPVFVPDGGVESLGMSTNVYKNIVAIDEKINKNLPTRHEINLCTNEATGHKTRYIDKASNQMLLRIDTDSYDVCRKLPSNIEEYDAVVVSDYNKGFLSDKDLMEIGERSRLSFLDTKKQYNTLWADKFTFIKINEKEAGENNWDKYGDNLIITKAARGCSYGSKNYHLKKPSEVRDVSGAGDTFLAAFSYSFATTNNVDDSILYAQDCCQKVISKKGVVTI
jgi:bifunctional ADP-heptose synthase (sugar kinase/adenylyltransferase)